MNSHHGPVMWLLSIWLTNVLFSLTVFGQNNPPVIFNEVYLDESGGDTSFIEIRRINSDTILHLQSWHIAILNSNRNNKFHLEVREGENYIDIFSISTNNNVFQVRGVFSFNGKRLEVGQKIAYIGKENVDIGNAWIGNFGDHSMVYSSGFSPATILGVKKFGYLVIILFKSERQFEGNVGRLETDYILNGFYDAIFVRGEKASPNCRSLAKLVNPPISKNLFHIMDDITGTGVSLSNCLGEQVSLPFWSKQWRHTKPSPGKENECPGRVQPNMDVEMAEVSAPSVPDDISDDCNEVSTAAFSKKRKLDEIIEETTAGPSCPVHIDGEMADIDVFAEATNAIERELGNDVPNPSWCPQHNFDEAWIHHIKEHQSEILPVGGKYNISLQV